MASAELTITLTDFCAAQGHATFTVLEDLAELFSKRISWVDAKESLEPAELKLAVFNIVREMVRRTGATNKSQVNAVIPQLKITLEYPTP